jgi:hypothetical protein
MHYTACWGEKAERVQHVSKIQLSTSVEKIYEMQSMGDGSTSILHIVLLVAKVKPPRLLEYEAGALTT